MAINPEPPRCSWCDQRFRNWAELSQHENEHRKADMAKAMGPDHSRTGIFVSHNCSSCRDGELPCKQGAPNLCDNPRARND